MEIILKPEAKRLHNLDYLRGVAAFGIMVYHYSSWVLGSYTAADFMGRVGVYGVAIFYVLSGLTLFHVYHEKMTPTWPQIVSFFKKRFFRIFPLLWVVTIVSILLSGKIPSIFYLFLNLSGLFGFFAWDVTFSGGVWSIGNELVFYVFFPLFILCLNKSKLLFWVLGFIIFLIFIYFAFIKMQHGDSSQKETRDYFNPLNNLFLFFAGFMIGHIFHSTNISNLRLTLIVLAGIGLFVFFPAIGKRIDLLTGINRLVFALACCLICLAFYKVRSELPNILHQPLIILGEASYSVYLLHLVVLKGYKLLFANTELSKLYIMWISIITTLTLSYFTYNYFEKFFMSLGKKKNRLALQEQR